MALRSKVFKVALATAVGLLVGVGTQQESEATGYQDLCGSVPSACDYAPSTAPVIAINVCFSAGTGVHVKGVGNCPANTYPFYVKFGEIIDATNGIVQPYIVLPDACGMGYCEVANINTPPGTEGPMCCDANGDCVETAGICPPTEIAVWCPDGQQPAQQNGEWVCEES